MVTQYENDTFYGVVTQPLQGCLDKKIATRHVRDVTSRNCEFWVYTWTSQGWMQIVRMLGCYFSPEA